MLCLFFRKRLFSIPGGYRKMITMPEDLIWKTLKYENPDNDLILSDSDVLLNKELPENGIGIYIFYYY